MSFPKRRDLVDSGVGWLGAIPSNWQVLPAKALFSSRSVKAFEEDVHLTPSQKYGVLPQTEYMEITGARVVLNLTDSGQMKHVEPGDFVSHLRSFQGGLELARSPGKVSGAYTVLVPREDQHPGYWRYALKSDTYIQALQTTTDQLRDGQSIRMKEFSLIRLPLVPIEEQKAIADFLDLELAQIDALIARQSKFLELLEERKNARLFASFSSETGWGRDKMSRLVDAFKGPRAQLLSSIYLASTSGEFPVYSGSTEGDGIIGWLPDFDFDLGHRGGLLVSTVGSEKVMTTRRVFGRLSLSQNCMLIIPKKIEIDFLEYALEAALNQIRGNFMGHMQASFRVSDLRQMWLGYPESISEQLRIAKEYKLNERKLKEVRDVINLALVKFNERRQSLISAAVTGKIDVRKAS